MTYGDSDKTVSVALPAQNEEYWDGTTTYQWYSNTANNNTSGTAITNANAASYAIPSTTGAGTHYYYCVVNRTRGNGERGSVTSNVAAVTVAPKPVTVSGITASNKTYDGNTTATLNYASPTFTGKLDGDTLTVTAATGAFADKNVGTGKTVNITGITLGGASAANYTLSSTTSSTTADITTKTLTITADAKAKVYGASDPALTYSASGLVSGDTITGALSRVAGENVGDYAITQGTLTAGDNYAITYNGANLAIGAATLTVTADAQSKTYGDADPALTYTATGFTNGDTVSVLTGALTRAEGESVGAYAITQGTLTAGGNYNISFTGANLTIGKRSVTVSGITASDKTYNGGTAATLVTTGATFAGKLESDTLTVSATGTFDSADVGTGKTVTISGLTLGGASAGNYTLAASGQQTTTTANITAAALTTVSAAGWSGTYDKTAHGITVTCAGDAAGAIVTYGTDGTNYIAEKPEYTDVGTYTVYYKAEKANYGEVTGSATVTITAKPITAITGLAAAEKVYDGTTSATLVASGAGFTGIIAGDTLSVSGDAAFADASAGISKTVNFSNLVLGGASAGNYALSATTATGAGNITPKPVTVGGITAQNKVYDNSTGATLDYSGVTFEGKVGSDDLSVTATGTFADAAVGANKTVNITGLTLGGTSAANYTVSGASQTTTTASITAFAATITTDPTAGAIVYGQTLADSVLTGGVANTPGTFAWTDGTIMPAVADSGATAYSVTFTPTDTTNYSPTTTTVTVTVTPKEIGASWTDTGFTYDGSPHVPTATATGAVAGDALTLTVTGAETNAGNYTASVAGITGAAAGNYALPASGLTQSFTIGNASQAAPSGLVGVAPTSEGGGDGKITGTTSSMVYCVSPDTVPVVWTPCGDGETGGLGAGTYQVCYDAKTNYDASPAATVVVPAYGKKAVSVTGGTGSRDYAPGEAVSITATAAPNGKLFKAWEITPSVALTVGTLTDTTIGFVMPDPAVAITVTATYEDGSITIPASASVSVGGTMTLTATTVPADAVVTWTSDDTSKATVAGGVVTGVAAGSATITASITVNGQDYSDTCVVTVTETAFTVTFDANGGSVTPASGTTGADGKLASLPTPTRAPYTFAGWFTAASGGTVVTTATVFTANATIYAHWTAVPVPSSGGSSYDPPTDRGTSVSVTLSGGNGTENLSASVSGSTASISNISDSAIRQITGAEGESASVVLDLSGLDSKITETSLAASAFQKLAEAVASGDSGSSLTIKLPGSTVSFDARAVASLATQARSGSVSLSVSAIGTSGLNTRQRDALRGREVAEIFSVTLKINGAAVADFDGGVASVSVPFTPTSGRRGADYHAWHTAADGSTERMPTVYELLRLIFRTPHLSNYAVIYETPTSAYSDVSTDAAYFDAVEYVTECGLMNGVGDGLFAPDNTVSRAMLVTILWRLDGEQSADGAQFLDVDGGDWYGGAVAWASANGIVGGYGDGTFGPNDLVTREQLAAILYRYAQSKGEGFTGAWMFLLDYPDAGSISEWADEAMHWMVMRGVITDKGGTLDPQGSVSRAEVAEIFMRFCKTMGK